MMKMKTRGKVLTLSVTTIILFSIIVNIIVYYQFNSHITNSTLTTYSNLSMKLVDSSYEGEWNVKDDQLYKGDKLINDDTELVDLVKENSKVECTIFLNDMRVATTLMKDNQRDTGTKADANVTKQVLEKGIQYIGSVDVVDKSYDGVYVPIKDESGTNIGMFFIGMEEDIIDAQVYDVLFDIIIVTLFLIVIIIGIAILFTSKVIIQPIKFTKKYMHLLANGDLSFDINQRFLERKDEFGEMAKAIGVTQDAIKGMILNIKESSQNIDEHSQDLSLVSENMEIASNNVTIAIQDIAKNASNQADGLSIISDNTNQFGQHLENIMNAFEDVLKNANAIGALANESSKNMDNLVQSIHSVKKTFNQNEENMSMLHTKIENINDISNLINGIANQTNLLALNASIEAARAGEAGKGFAIVAEEIGKLAFECKNSSESINNLIGDVIQNNDSMLYTSDELNKELLDEIEFVKIAINSFEDIIKSINTIIPQIQRVNNSSVSIENNKNLIVEKISEAAFMSQQVSASSQEISASSEEMNASTEEVALAAHKLSSRTKEMLESLEKFKI